MLLMPQARIIAGNSFAARAFPEKLAWKIILLKLL
jgi:hypothetical protein